MAFTCKKRQSKRRLLSQIDDFSQDIIICNTMSDRQETATVNEGSGDQEFIVHNPGSNSAANQYFVDMKTLEKCFNERIDREMGVIVDTVEKKIQNANLTAIDGNVASKIGLAKKSINASSGVMRPVSWQIQNVENTLPLFKTFPKGILH